MLESSHEEQDGQEWPDVSIQGASKKMKLVKLDGWGETPVSESITDIRQWLLESSLVEQDSQEWPEVSSQGASNKMKQMEFSFAKILDVQTEPESDREHARRMDETPTKLHVLDETSSSPYVRRKGKMTKKETKEQASKTETIFQKEGLKMTSMRFVQRDGEGIIMVQSI